MDTALDAAVLETVVLDIDGTLLDSNCHQALSWARAFEGARHPVELWRLHRHIGMGGDRLVAAVSDDEVEQRIGDEVRERWAAAYDEIIDETRLLPGARELVEALGAAGLKVVLASSGIPRHAEHALGLLDADEHADAATTSEDAEESKPHPELVEKALEQVSCGSAVMIGDSVWDVESGARADLPVIALLCGGYGRAELTDAGAVAVFDDPADLLARLDRALSAAEAARDH